MMAWLSSIPLLTVLVAVPVVGAVVVSRVRPPEQARRVTVATAALMLGLTLCVAWLFRPGVPGVQQEEAWGVVPLWGMSLHLGVDGVSVGGMVLLALILLGLLVSGPRSVLEKPTLVALLLTASGLLGVLVARDFCLLVLFWLASLLPANALISRAERTHAESRLPRTFRAYLLGGMLPLVALAVGLWLLGRNMGAGAPFDLEALRERGVPSDWQQPLFMLLMVGVAVRMAVVPLHSWLPELLARGPYGVSILFVNVHVGLYVLTRVALPLLPEAWAEGAPVLQGVGLGGALYGSVLALAQVDLRRTVGFLLVSQSGMMLAGVASGNAQSLAGALLQGLAAGLAFTGLMMVVRALEARAGTTDMRRLGGLVRRNPRMAAFFFLLGFASLGFPGTLSFVGEDLLLHGVLDTHLAAALPLLLATAINGITFLRAFQRTFLGPYAHGRAEALSRVEDLLPRERVGALALCALAFLGGLFPGPLLRLREHPALAEAPSVVHADSGAPGGATGGSGGEPRGRAG